MNTVRMGLFCVLVGWMATGAQAQLGTYGSPDPIPLGQFAPQNAYVPAVAGRPYYTSGDAAGPNLINPPANVIPQPPAAIPQAPSESAAVSQMLNQPNPPVAPPNANGDTTMMPPGGYLNGACNGNECGGCCGDCCMPWYATARALYMTRDQPTKYYLCAECANSYIDGYFNEVNWTWGGEIVIGRRFGCCNQWFVEGSYWALADSHSEGDPPFPGPYTTPLNFSAVDILGTTGGGGINGTQQGTAWFDTATAQHFWRNYEVQNFEVNFGRAICCGGPCNHWDVDGFVGIRWFRFQDGLLFGSQRNIGDGSPYAGTWLYLDDHIANDLVGPQVGVNVGYRFAECWKVFVTPKFGLYNNRSTLDYNVYVVDPATGVHYQGSSENNPNRNYPVHATADNVAFLAQLDLGLDWQVTRNISTQIGYRVVAAAGIALSDGQIPVDGSSTQNIADISHNNDLILHGAFAGLTFTW